jgi:iron(III) transport system substrate-binding protein
MTRHRVWRCLAVALAALGGCGGDAPEVIVYVAVDRFQAEPLLRDFEAESGVRVRAVYDAEAAKTTGLVTRLLAESGRPRCDVFWNNEIAQTLLLADRGLLAAYDSPAAAGIPLDRKDPQGRWTAVALRARVIVYNTDVLQPREAPQSIYDLARPEWHSRVAVANPQFGTTRTHVAALFAALGPERAQGLLNDLLANEVQIVDGNAMVRDLVARARPGTDDVCVGLTDTDDVKSGQADGRPIDMVFPDQDALGTLLVPSTVALVHDAPHPEAARRLIDFLVARETGERLAAGDSGYLAVRPPREGKAGGAIPARVMAVSHDALLEQLDPSSRWTAEHFRP